jgi:hypothetical protein
MGSGARLILSIAETNFRSSCLAARAPEPAVRTQRIRTAWSVRWKCPHSTHAPHRYA